MVVTLYQHDIVWHDPEANRRQVEQALCEAPQSDIFVLPETFTTGFGRGMSALAEPPEGDTLGWARLMAARHEVLIVGSWLVREGAEGMCRNRMHWVRPDGSYGFYDKAHAFRVGGEAEEVACGRQREVFEWRGWRIKPAVCYDLRFPTWLRNARRGGGDDVQLDYDLLLLCANWPQGRVAAWETLLRARAIENLCYVVGCNRRGSDALGTVYGGNSLVLDYKGQAVQPVAERDGLMTASLDQEALGRFRERWPFHLDFD